MENQYFNKKNLIILLAVILGICVLVWLFSPQQMTVITPTTPNTARLQELAEARGEGENSNGENFIPPYEGFNQQIAGAQGSNMGVQGAPADMNQGYNNASNGSIIASAGSEASPIEGVAAETGSGVPSNYYLLDDGNSGNSTIINNMCSKSCCSKQWPVPFAMPENAYVCANKDQFVPSNSFCNTSLNDSGCLCLTKQQAQGIANRYGNGNELF